MIANDNETKFENVEDIYPLTPAQQGMLVHTTGQPSSGLYVQQIVTRLTGGIQIDKLKLAWDRVLDRHAALRSVFVWEGLDEPLQVVREQVDVEWEVLDWRQHSAETLKAEEGALLFNDRRLGFDLSQAPLMRMYAIRVAEDEWSWVWSFHHLLCDGWSVAILRHEIEVLYAAEIDHVPVKLPPVIPFRDHIARLHDSGNPSDDDFWREQVKGFSEPTRLAVSTAREPNSKREASEETQSRQCQQELLLSTQLTERLSDFARQNGLTLNTVFQGAWAILLSRCSGRNDVVYGVTVSGRSESLEESSVAVGAYINTLPVCLSIDGTDVLADWLGQLQLKLGKIQEFQHSSLSRIQRLSEIKGELFDSLFVFENYPATAAATPSPSFYPLDVRFIEKSNYPLALLVVPGSQLTLIINHHVNRFAESVAGSLLSSMECLLHSFVQNPTAIVANLSLVEPLTSTSCNGVHVDQGITATQQEDRFESVVEWFVDQVTSRPHQDALKLGNTTLCYQELNSMVDEIAVRLRRVGVHRNGRVAIACHGSVETIAAIFAVMKCGAAYVPIDPDIAESELEDRLRSLGIDSLVGDVNMRPLASRLSVPLVESNKDILRNHAASENEIESLRKFLPDASDVAYLIFTSGSTGQAKAVEISHGALALSTLARTEYYKTSPESFLLLSPLWFDSSVAGLFWTICTGGTLVVPTNGMISQIHDLNQYLHENHVTHTLCLPSLYGVILRFACDDQLASLKTVIVAGEECTNSILDTHFTQLPTTDLVNEYGPTEASVWATVARLTDRKVIGPVPIGRAAPGSIIAVADQFGSPLPDEVIGEIWIGGSRLALGYAGDPALTDSKFVERDGVRFYRTGDRAYRQSDGQLVFCGRTDQQFKINGRRIEAGEIESALRQVDGVDDAIVELVDRQTSNASAEPSQLVQLLDALPTETAMSLLKEAERFDVGGSKDYESPTQKSWRQESSNVVVHCESKDPSFVSTPRAGQRKWLIDQALAETAADLEHLDRIANTFVRGNDQPHVPKDLVTERLSADEIMEDWQTPLMQSMVDYGCQDRGDVLEIGFGRGVAATFIQDAKVHSHTIVEMSSHSVRDFYEPWVKEYPDRSIDLLHGRWQDVLDRLGTYDTVFFHAFPMNEAEFVEYIAESVTFAEHFFATAARLLRPGGVFTYMTTEIDSISRRHQRALFEHFDEVHMKLQPLCVPEDTRDAWWANSMVVLRAMRSHTDCSISHANKVPR